MVASEEMQFEKAIEYRDLFKQREADCTETENHA